MNWDRSNVRMGALVTSTKGERLGKVIRSGPETFVVEKGVFFPKDYELRYDHITELGEDAITYSLSDFESRLGATAQTSPTIATAAASRAATAAATPARARVASLATGSARDGSTGRGEIRIPLMEEEVGIEKVSRETGHVRIHKTVKTEEKHFTVPVTREDVIIERVSAKLDDTALPPVDAFKEQDLDLALHEEDVRVSKRSRLREEVVVRTVVQAIEKEASASLRHEEADIDDTRTGVEARRGDTTPGPDGYNAPSSRR